MKMTLQTKNVLLHLHELADYYENDKENLSEIQEMMEKVMQFEMRKCDSDMNKEKCVHILGMKESGSNACYIVDSETDEWYIKQLNSDPEWKSIVRRIEWFKFCPRCGQINEIGERHE